MTATAWVAAVLGCAVGAPARYLLDGFVQDHRSGDLPWGTLTVNVLGALVLGLVTGLGLHHGLGRLPTAAVGSGFCGAFTTFSTFSFETVRLGEAGDTVAAAKNVGVSVVLGLGAAALGLGLTTLG